MMLGLWSEAIEPKANRRLLPPAPSPREGVWGWGNVGNLVPSHAKSGPAGLLLCGQWDNYRTIIEDLIEVYLFGLQHYCSSGLENGSSSGD